MTMFFIAPFAGAQIIVSDAILEFSNQERLIESIAVGNASQSDALNVNAQVFEIQKPGQADESQISTNDIFAVPTQFSLSPRTQRTVRLASKERPNTEKIYRIVFFPQKINDIKGDDSRINILTSTSVMMILNPPEPDDNLTWVRQDSRVIFKNSGNTNIILRQKGMCNKETFCQIDGQRLWAGDQWILNLPSSLAQNDLILEYRALGNIKELKIPYEE